MKLLLNVPNVKLSTTSRFLLVIRLLFIFNVTTSNTTSFIRSLWISLSFYVYCFKRKKDKREKRTIGQTCVSTHHSMRIMLLQSLMIGKNNKQIEFVSVCVDELEYIQQTGMNYIKPTASLSAEHGVISQICSIHHVYLDKAAPYCHQSRARMEIDSVF